jgi:hypothetical protein
MQLTRKLKIFVFEEETIDGHMYVSYLVLPLSADKDKSCTKKKCEQIHIYSVFNWAIHVFYMTKYGLSIFLKTSMSLVAKGYKTISVVVVFTEAEVKKKYKNMRPKRYSLSRVLRFIKKDLNMLG